MANSFAYLRRSLQLVTPGLLLMLAGCATLPPPTGEIGLAQQAISRADGADADQYAGSQITEARVLLEQAQAFVGQSRNDDARNAAARAAALADLAHARSVEAVTNSELALRRAQVTELRQRLQVGE